MKLAKTLPLTDPDQAPPPLPAGGPPSAANLGELPSNAPDWMRRGRELSDAIEFAIQGGEITPQLQGCIERASEAWYPARLSWADIEKTVGIVARLDEQLRTTPPDSESAYLVLAQVVRRRLPSNVRRIAGLPTVVSIVREMQAETIESIARRQALVRLLGWQDMVERWAHKMIQLAGD